LDNGDGGGIANDGILQAGEIDDTAFICTLVPAALVNSSFDSGGTGWVLSGNAFPTGGGAINIDTHAVSSIAQDVNLTAFSTAAVTVEWNSAGGGGCFGGGLSTLALVIEPSGGGAALFSTTLGTCNGPGGTTPVNVIPSPSVVNINSVANQPVRIKVVVSGGDWHPQVTAISLTAS
jgi:hypothetical protein